jgi:hypothetical protein
LKNQVEYYKGAQDALSKFIENILEEDKINEQIRKYFIAKVLDLQGETLQLSILYKENLMWKERQAKVQDQVEFIKEIQKSHGHEDHGIRMLTKNEISRIE